MSFKDRVLRFLNLRKRYRLWQRVVGSLAVVVVFVTTYMLILPAITMENGVYCGMEEHTHTDDCYTTVLVCTEGQIDTSELDAPPEYKCTESLHTHTSDCYDENGALVCGKADFFVHTHNDLCYFDGELVCPLEETEPHTHTSDCFTEDTRYICGLEESEGHTHDDSCYSVTEELVCGLEESEEHSHDDSCYERTEELVCGLEESEGHTHDDSCMAAVRTLVCDKAQAHIHDESCYENGQLICGLPEISEHVHSAECMSADGITSGHVHTADCYEKVLSCGMEEHTHTDDCHNKSLWEGSGDSVTSGSGLDNVESGVSLMTADEPTPMANIDTTTVTITKGTDKYTAHITQKEDNTLLREIIEGLGIEYHQGSYEGYNDAVLVDIVDVEKDGDGILDADAVNTLFSDSDPVTVEVANINLSGNKGERRLIALPADETIVDAAASDLSKKLIDSAFQLTHIEKTDTNIQSFTFTTTADKLNGTLCFVSEKIFGGYVSSIEIKDVTDGSAFWDNTTSYDPEYYEKVKYLVRSNPAETGTEGDQPEDIPVDELLPADSRNETEKGYDNDPHNGIVRSFDNVVYDLTISTALRESAVEYYESDHVKLYLEIKLPKDISEANFDMENMMWMNDPLIKYVNIDPATEKTKYIMWRDSEVSDTGEPIFHKYKDQTKDERDPDDESVGSSLNMLNKGTPKNGDGSEARDKAYRTPQVGSDSGIDINCQILTGYVELTSSSGGLVLPGTANLSASINVLASADGDVIQPTFNAWILGNNENLGAEQETAAEGGQAYEPAEPVDCSNTAGVITKANTTNSFNVNNEIVIVTAAPRYDAHIRLNQDIKRVGTYDFTNGVEYDAKGGDLNNSKLGRLMGYGVTLQLYNKTDNREGHKNKDPNAGYFEKGMKGIELPAGDIEFDISFTATEKDNVPKSDRISLPVGGDPLLSLDSENSDTHVITADGEAVAYEDYEAAILEEQLNNDDTVNGIVGRTIVSIISDDSDEVVSYVDETDAEDSENIFDDGTEETSPIEETDPTDENVGSELESRTLIKAVSYAAMPVAEVISQSMAVGAPRAETQEPASDPTDEEYGIMPIAAKDDDKYCTFTDNGLTYTWEFKNSGLSKNITLNKEDTFLNLYAYTEGVSVKSDGTGLAFKNAIIGIPIPFLDKAQGGTLTITTETTNEKRTITIGNHTYNTANDIKNKTVSQEIHKTDITTDTNGKKYILISGNDSSGNSNDVKISKIVFEGTTTPPTSSCDENGNVTTFGESKEDEAKKTITWNLGTNMPSTSTAVKDGYSIDGGIEFIDDDSTTTIETNSVKLGDGDGLRIPLPIGTTGGKLNVNFTSADGGSLTIGKDPGVALANGKESFFSADQIKLNTAALATFTAFPYSTIAAGDSYVEIYASGGSVSITSIALTYDTPNGGTYGTYNFDYGTKTKTWDFTTNMPMLPTAEGEHDGYNKVLVEDGGDIHGIKVDLSQGGTSTSPEVDFISYNHGTGDPWYYLSAINGAILKLPVPPTTTEGKISVTFAQDGKSEDRYLIVGNNGSVKTDSSNKLLQKIESQSYAFGATDLVEGGGDVKYLCLYTRQDYASDIEITNITLTYQATPTPAEDTNYGTYSEDTATKTRTWGFTEDMPDYDSVEITADTPMEGKMSLVKGGSGKSYFHNPDAEGKDPYLYVGENGSDALKIPVPENTQSGTLTITPFAAGGKVGIGTAAAAGTSPTTISGTSAASITFTADNIDAGFIYLWCNDAKISSISMKYDNTGLLNAYIYFPTQNSNVDGEKTDDDRIKYAYYSDKDTKTFMFETSEDILTFNSQLATNTRKVKANIADIGEHTTRISQSTLDPASGPGSQDARIKIKVPDVAGAKNYKLFVGGYSTGSDVEKSKRSFYLFDLSKTDGYKYQTKDIIGGQPPTSDGQTLPDGNSVAFDALESGKEYTLACSGNFFLCYIALVAYSVDDGVSADWTTATTTPPVTPDVPEHRKGVYIYFNDKKNDVEGRDGYVAPKSSIPVVITYGGDSTNLKLNDVFSRSKVFKEGGSSNIGKAELGEYGTYNVMRTASINSTTDGTDNKYNSIMFITVPADVNGAKLKVGAQSNSAKGTDLSDKTKKLWLVDYSSIKTASNKTTADLWEGTVKNQITDETPNDTLSSNQQVEFLGLEPGKTYALMGGDKGDFQLFYVLLETYDYEVKPGDGDIKKQTGAELYRSDITAPGKESPADKNQGRPNIPKAKNNITPVMWDYKPNIAYTKYGEWGRFLDWDKDNERTNFAKQAAPYNSGYETKSDGSANLSDDGKTLKAVPGWDEQQIYWGGDWKVTKSIINDYGGEDKDGTVEQTKNPNGEVWDAGGATKYSNQEGFKSTADEASTTKAQTSTYHVKVSDYTFDFDFEGADGGHFPTSYAKETYGTDRHSKYGFGSFVRAFSSGYFTAFVPTEGIGAGKEYSLTATITNFHAKSISGKEIDREQYLLEQDTYGDEPPQGMQSENKEVLREGDLNKGMQKNLSINERGSSDIDIRGANGAGRYLAYDDSWNSNGMALSYLSVGQKVDLWASSMMRTRNDYSVGATNVLLKFDNAFKIDENELDGGKANTQKGNAEKRWYGSMLENYLGSGSVTILFAADPGQQEGYDGAKDNDHKRMQNVKEENLYFYENYKDLVHDGYTCVGVLMEVRDVNIPSGNYISLRVPVVVQNVYADKPESYNPNEVHATVSSIRGWSYSDELDPDGQVMHGVSWSDPDWSGNRGTDKVKSTIDDNWENDAAYRPNGYLVATDRQYNKPSNGTLDTDHGGELGDSSGKIEINGKSVANDKILYYHYDTYQNSDSNASGTYIPYKKVKINGTDYDNPEKQKYKDGSKDVYCGYDGGMSAVIVGYQTHIAITDSGSSMNVGGRNGYDKQRNDKPHFTVNEIYAESDDPEHVTSAGPASFTLSAKAAYEKFSEQIGIISQYTTISSDSEEQLRTVELHPANYKTGIQIEVTIDEDQSGVKSLSIDKPSIVMTYEKAGGEKASVDLMEVQKDAEGNVTGAEIPSDPVNVSFDGAYSEMTAQISDVTAKSFKLVLNNAPVGVMLPDIEFDTTIDEGVQNNQPVVAKAMIRGDLDKRKYEAVLNNIDDDNVYLINQASAQFEKSVSIGSSGQKFVELSDVKDDTNGLITYTITYDNLDGDERQNIRLYDVLPRAMRSGISEHTQLELVSVGVETLRRAQAGDEGLDVNHDGFVHSRYPSANIWLTTYEGDPKNDPSNNALKGKWLNTFSKDYGSGGTGSVNYKELKPPTDVGVDVVGPYHMDLTGNKEGEDTTGGGTIYFNSYTSKPSGGEDIDLSKVTGIYASIGSVDNDGKDDTGSTSSDSAIDTKGVLKFTITVKASGSTEAGYYSNVANVENASNHEDASTTAAKAAVVTRSISGRVFKDNDQNGLYEKRATAEAVSSNTDAPYENVTVSLFKKGTDGSYTQVTHNIFGETTEGKFTGDDDGDGSITTDANGNYSFDKLPAGEYVVAFKGIDSSSKPEDRYHETPKNIYDEHGTSVSGDVLSTFNNDGISVDCLADGSNLKKALEAGNYEYLIYYNDDNNDPTRKLTEVTEGTPTNLAEKCVPMASGTEIYDGSSGTAVTSVPGATVNTSIGNYMDNEQYLDLGIPASESYSLPETGGIGTTGFKIAGGALTLMAIALLICEGRRKSRG